MNRYLEETSMLDFSNKELQRLIAGRAVQHERHFVEVYLEGVWYELEAFILDVEYLQKLQKINAGGVGAFCGYGVAVKAFVYRNVGRHLMNRNVRKIRDKRI